MVGSRCFASVSVARTPTRKSGTPGGLFACLRGRGLDGSPEAGERSTHQRGDHRSGIDVRCEMMMMMQGESGNLRLDTPHRVIDGGAASVFWPTPTRDQTSEVMKKLFPEQTAASFTPLPPSNLVPDEHTAMASALLVDGASFSHQSAAPPAGTTSATRADDWTVQGGQPSSAPDPFEWVKVRDKILGRGKSHTYSDDYSPRRLEVSTLDDSGIEIPVAEPDEEAEKGVKSPVQSQQQPAGEKTAVHHVGPIDDDEASGRATPAANSGGCSPGIIDRLAPSDSSAAMPLKQNQVKWGVIRSTEPHHAQAGNSERQPCIQPSSRAWAADILTVPPPYLAHQRIQAVSSRAAGLTVEHNKFESPHFCSSAPSACVLHSKGPAPGKVPRLAIFSSGSVDSTVHPSSSPLTTPVPCAGGGRAASAPSVPKTMPTTSFHRLCNTPRGGVKVVAAEELSVGRVNDRSRGRRILANSTVFC
jgi:hypothetical protein